MIDAIIALIRGSADVDAAPRRPAWRSRSSSPRSRRTTSSTCSCAGSPQLERPEAARRARRAAGDDQRARVDPRRATAKLRSVIKDELAEVREKFADERRTADHLRPRRPRRRSTSSRTKRSSSCCRQSGYVKTVAADAFRRQGRGGRGVRGGNLQRRGLRRAPAHHDRALVPAVLLEPRPGLPAARARDPDEGAHRAGHRARQPHRARSPTSSIQAIIDTRTYEDGALPVLRARSNGMVKKTRMTRVRLVAAHAASSPSTSSDGRRAGAGSSRPPATTTSSWSRANGMTIRFSEDDVRADGPGHRRRAGHEAQERRRRRRRLRRRPRRRR